MNATISNNDIEQKLIITYKRILDFWHVTSNKQ